MKPIELVTEEPQRNLKHTWTLYWFHATDPDASCPADAGTLERAGYVPAERVRAWNQQAIVTALLASPELRRCVLAKLPTCGYGCCCPRHLGAEERAVSTETHLAKIAQLAEATGKLVLMAGLVGPSGDLQALRNNAGYLLAAVSAWRVEAGRVDPRQEADRGAELHGVREWPAAEVSKASSGEAAGDVVTPVPAKVTLRLPYLKHADGSRADIVLEEVSVSALADNGFVPQLALRVALDRRDAAFTENARLSVELGKAQGELETARRITACPAGIALRDQLIHLAQCGHDDLNKVHELTDQVNALWKDCDCLPGWKHLSAFGVHNPRCPLSIEAQPAANPVEPPKAALSEVERFREEICAALVTSGDEPMKWLARELEKKGGAT